MDSDDGFMDYEEQSGDEEISEEDDDFVEMGLEAEPSTTQDKRDAEDFPYEVLPADQIVQFMVDCIKEVNAVVQVNAHLSPSPKIESKINNLLQKQLITFWYAHILMHNHSLWLMFTPC